MRIAVSTETAFSDVGGLSAVGQIRKLLGHSAVYGLGLVGSSVAALVLTPMFLHRLDRAEYGTLEVLNVFGSMMCSLLALGIGSVLIKIYLNDCRSDGERKQLISSVVVFMGIMGLLLLAVSHVFARPLSTLLLKDGRNAVLVQLAACASGLLLVQNMAMFCLRAKQWAGRFAAVSLTHLILIVALNFYFLLVLGMGVLGVQLAAVIGGAAAMLLGLVMIRSDLVPRFSAGAIKRVMYLSLPMFPASITPWVLNLSDRYFVNHFWGLADTGLYAVGYKIGMLGIAISINAFQLAWTPFFYRHSDSRETPKLCADILKLYVLVLVAGGLMLSVFAPEILRLIGKPEYWSAGWIVPYIAVSYVFYGIQFFTIPLFVRANQGKSLSMIMAGAAVLNVALNCLLIPRFGISGAIAATIAAFSLEAVLSLRAANRFYPVPYHYANLGKAFVLAAIVYLVFRGAAGGSVPSFVLKCAGLPLFAVLLLATKFFSKRELEVMQSIPGRLVRRLRPQPIEGA